MIMPMPGDQHRDTRATTNPFLEQTPTLNQYTAQEIATLQSRLDKQLGPEYISTRPGNGGGKVHYLAAEKVINLANEVFGFNGWSSAIQNVQIDFVDENAQNGKITLGLSTIVRVTLRDGTYHEDIGYGHIENCKGKAAAFEKAKKEAATDAMKRALRTFGNVLGNCLYDKDYLSKVTKVKVAPTRWDAENLHRHPDYAPIRKEAIANVKGQEAQASHRQSSAQSAGSLVSGESEEDFESNLFDDTDFSHPDEVHLDDTRNAIETPAKRIVPGQAQQRQQVPRMQSMPQMRPPNVQQPTPIQNLQQPQKPSGPPKPPNNADQAPAMRMPPPQAQQRAARLAAQQAQSNPTDAQAAKNQTAPVDRQPSNGFGQVETSGLDDLGFPVPRMPPPGAPEGFITGRNAEVYNQPATVRPPNNAIAFNPHAESPSIRRTHGINPGKSAPVARQSLGGGGGPAPPGAPPVQQSANSGGQNGLNGATTPVRTNFVNPSADTNRRIGMPQSGPPSGASNRGAYRPPTVNGVKRAPLSDVSNIQQLDGAGDAKKAKTDDGATDVQSEAPAQAAS